MPNHLPTSETAGWDVFISHRSLNKPWVECLARNLRARGYRVFLDAWELVPGRPFAPALWDGLKRARKGVLVATPEAVESGWVRTEYETMLGRAARQPEFSFVPLVFGEVAALPFLDNVHCVDFRDPAPAAYRRAFYCLLCGLEDRAPGHGGTVDGELEIPSPIRSPEPPPVTGESAEARFLDEVFDTLARSPILLLLAPAERAQPEVIAAIETRAADAYGEANTVHLMPPWSREAELDRYFAHLGRQCGFDEEIRSDLDWEDALDRRLSRGDRFFILVSRFEHGSEAGRRALAGILRGLNERHRHALAVVLSGGESLAELRYAGGELSLLNVAEVVPWPELTVADVVAWQQRADPEQPPDVDAAARILELCGGHPRLVRFCLDRRRRVPTTADEDAEALRRYDWVWQLFTPYRDDPAKRAQICRRLGQEDLGPAHSWPPDPLLRRLLWSGLLVERGRRLRWRCPLLREVGREVLECVT